MLEAELILQILRELKEVAYKPLICPERRWSAVQKHLIQKVKSAFKVRSCFQDQIYDMGYFSMPALK